MNEHDIPVLKPPPRLTAETLPLFARVTDAYHDRNLVVDLSETSFITSSGLGHLVMLGRNLAENDARLAFAGGSRSVQRLLDTVGLSMLMPHFRTVDEALLWLRDRSQET